MKMDNISKVYELATLINKAHNAYKAMTDAETYHNLEVVTYDDMVAADKEADKTRHAFYKAVRDTFAYFGITLKRGDWYGYYKREFNQLMSHEYGEYRRALDWERVALIKTVDQMSEYTTEIHD